MRYKQNVQLWRDSMCYTIQYIRSINKHKYFCVSFFRSFIFMSKILKKMCTRRHILCSQFLCWLLNAMKRKERQKKEKHKFLYISFNIYSSFQSFELKLAWFLVMNFMMSWDKIRARDQVSRYFVNFVDDPSCSYGGGIILWD